MIRLILLVIAVTAIGTVTVLLTLEGMELLRAMGLDGIITWAREFLPGSIDPRFYAFLGFFALFIIATLLGGTREKLG